METEHSYFAGKAKVLSHNANPCSQAYADAQRIAGGHAFEKHVLTQGEFPGFIRTRQQFTDHIADVMSNPTASRTLGGGRTAFWHEGTGTVVIRNPRAADLGTAFQPTNGRAYFDGLR